MEGFQAVNVGWLSILPPIIAIGLALITKEVISSLLIGILSGALIYTGGNVLGAVETTFDIMGNKMGSNINIILFLALLGALVVVVTKAGGSRAYGEWASQKVKSKKTALLSTSALGALIFIDDYFNCLTVGTVMRPVTDKYKVSRPKLAYILDSTAAPICIIAPISSWAVAVGSNLQSAGIEDGIGTFIRTIPFNLYAILTILMVIFICVSGFDFGPMRRFEREAAAGDKESSSDVVAHFEGYRPSDKGKVIDLVIPMLALIIFSVLAMLYLGGYFAGGVSIGAAFGNTDSSKALVLGGFAALIVAFVLFIPRKVLHFKEFMDGIGEGVKSMVPAFIILTLAWTISGICSNDVLGTGSFVGEVVRTSNMPVALIAPIIFIIAGLLAFATGTSWGTFGILIPIVYEICSKTDPSLMVICLAATLAGAVYGDHCSPISDTTILSSTGAGSNHLDHVSSQMPYATVVAGACFIGYLVGGFTDSLPLTILSGVAAMAAILFIIRLNQKRKDAKGPAAPAKA